jgi:ubiquinone/menaquinone biosynthesis C-methylase UbiE
MSGENKGPEILFQRESLYQGWDEYYNTEDKADAAWGDQPPPFLGPAVAEYARPGRSFVDFGAGDGRNSLPLARIGGHLTLVDIAPGGLRRAGEQFEAEGLSPTPTLVVASLESLPLADGQFDLGVCIDALPQVHRPRLALEEMARVLKPGGLLLVNLFTPDDCAFGEGEMVGPRSYLYKNTLFNFYDERDVEPLIRGLFEVVRCERARWQDPPHVPFRPYPHTHNALVYALRVL